MGISNVKNTPIVANSINTQKNAATSGYIKRSAADSFELSGRVHVGNYPFSNIKNEILASMFPQALITKYGNRQFLEAAMEANPKIEEILDSVNIPKKINMENINSGINSHFTPTQKTALGIMKHCGENFSTQDYNTMIQATMLHDIGKAFIPKEILNKPGALAKIEKQIVDIHSLLGYEILKTGGVSTRVLNLVKNHHNYDDALKNDIDYSLHQIIKIADIWSALKEKRSYKEAFDNETALKILYEDAIKGKFEIKYIDALKKFIKSVA